MIYDTNYDISCDISYQLIYEPNYDCSNILLIDSAIQDYQDIVNSVNSNTMAIVYSYSSTKEELSSILNNFTKIERIGFAFSFNPTSNTFLDNKLFFSIDLSLNIVPQSENLLFLIDIFNKYNIKNADYLACDTLNYPEWNNYYNILISNTSTIIGASDNKTGNIKYGGDWILESTGQDIESIYFTKNINYYEYLFDVAVWASLSFVAGITSYNYNLYVGSYFGSLKQITQFPINSNRTAGTAVVWYTYTQSLYAVAYYNGFIYSSIGPNSTGPIIQIPVNANGTAGTANTSWITNISAPFTMVGYQTYLFTANSSGIFRIIINENNTSGGIITWNSTPSIGLAINNSFLYASLDQPTDILIIPINSNGTAGTATRKVTSYSMYGMAIYNSYLYSNSYTYTGGTKYVVQFPINSDGSLGTMVNWKQSTNDYMLTVAQSPAGEYSLYETHINNGNISQFDLVQPVPPISSTGYFFYNNIDISNNFKVGTITTTPQYSGANFSTKFFTYYNNQYYDLAQLYSINPTLISNLLPLTNMYTNYNGQYYDLISFFKPQILFSASLSVSPSKCNGCFSTLLLNNDYTGFILKIRRTDGTFMSFYSTANGVLTNGSGTTIATFLSGSTGYIDTWYDQSGKGNHATQTTTASQPIFDVTNNCLDFGYSNSSNLFMNMPSGTIPVGVLDASYSFVVRHGNARVTFNGGFISGGTHSLNKSNSFRFNSGIHSYWNYWYDNDFGWSDTNTNVPISSIVTYNGTTKTQKGYISNTLQTTTLSRTGTNTDIAVQSIGKTTASEFLQGQLYSVLIYSVELLQSDITTINSYLTQSYRIVGNTSSFRSDLNNIYTFTSVGGSSTLTLNETISVTILCIGGGGGGGWDGGGGGGGGGAYINTLTLSPGTYTITIGGGGAAATITSAIGSNGGNSSFIGGSINIISYGGGGGGNNHNTSPAGNGGNGGGQGAIDTGNIAGTFGTGTTGQGNNGGASLDRGSGGGGGGYSAAGSTGTSTNGGNGGNGISSSITGTSTWYGGGGGGGTWFYTIGGIGGEGGGGNGGTTTNGTNATFYGGGGGGSGNAGVTIAGSGYQGICIISIPIS